MKQIVEQGMKLDLHIHSCYSSAKDGEKVKNNTIENIPLLIKKLNENGVNICAITDHDIFSMKMYEALKEAERDSTSIMKVLPGVEFSVWFSNAEEDEEPIHVVTLFSDANKLAVANIENVLSSSRPNKKGAYTEEEFLKVLRSIELDTILIAHQKNSLYSKKPRKNDANSLGEEYFLELVAADYFEAFEFKNKRNEVLNKSYLHDKNISEKVRFVTGTDCHDWSVYPRETPQDTMTDFPFTYAKCLPTFKGLVMAMTDHHRLKRVNSFFNVDKTTLDFIEIESGRNKIKIPLSKGINAIIGDNSIGKSFLLHALSGFNKNGESLEKQQKDGYKDYLKKKGLKIRRQLDEKNTFVFDMQGEVRSKFEKNRLTSTEFARYFPKSVDPTPYKNMLINEIDSMIASLENRFSYEREIENLKSFTLIANDDASESLSFDEDIRTLKESDVEIGAIISAIRSLKINYDALIKLSLDEQDVITLNGHLEELNRLEEKYKERKESIRIENEKIEKVATVLGKVKNRHNVVITDSQKLQNAFRNNTAELKNALISIISEKSKMKPYSMKIPKTDIEVNTNTIQDYQFVSKLNIKGINSEIIFQHINRLFKSKRNVDLNSVKEKTVKDFFENSEGMTPLQNFRHLLIKSFDEDFTQKQTIVKATSDKNEELSAGLNAKTYFDILSYENSSDGIYVIDQPEDNVSQKAIKDYMLECFRTMAENRQVIMVTHNPQFIVNLDVDNIILISLSSTGELQFQYGALEYECEEYNVINLVADKVDGGLKSIQERWKRYEKNTQF